MAYATPLDMIDRFGVVEMIQLTDISVPRLGGVNPVTADRALDDASAEIDGWLVGRIALPLATPPALLRVYCCDIARYRLMNVNADDRAKAAYEVVMGYLRRVASGDVSLTAPADAPAAVGLGIVVVDGGTKHFGRTGDW